MRLSLSRHLLCVCLVFGLLFASSPISLADEPAQLYTQEELEEGIYTGSGGLSVYLDGTEQTNDGVATIGTVSDQSNLLSIGYDVYSTAFNFRTEENFVPTASIGYTKSFADSVLTEALKDTQVSTLDTAEQVFKGIIGETIILHYQDENGSSTLPKDSKITLDLTFEDKTLAGSSSWRKAMWSYDSPFSFKGIGSASEYGNYINSATPLLNFQNSTWNSSGCKFYLGNTVTVYFLNSEGEQTVLGEYFDVSSINTTFTAPDDVLSVYIDVQYDMDGGVLYKDTMAVKAYLLTFPSIYNLGLSGNISVDTSGVNTGLLKSIIEWLRNILTAIKALPQQIADKVIEGIKALFIPSSENIMSTFDGLKTMAEEKLGFLYTIFNMVYDLFNSIITGLTNPMTTLTIPSFSLPWIDGTSLTLWNEMTFPILPEGLDILKDLVHLLTSLVLITATISHCVEYFRDFFKKE